MINILVTDPNPAFGGMTQQVLEETGRFNVTLVGTGAETVTAAGKAHFDIVLAEATMADLSLRDLVTALRLNQPDLPIIVALPLGEEARPDVVAQATAQFDIQGVLSKPFYIPDLARQIEEALTKPVGGVTPAPRAVEAPTPKPTPVVAPVPAPKAAPATAPTATGKLTPPKRSAPPAPAWLEDVNRAAQYLTTLTLESSAEAAFLMRGQHLIAFAGQCSKAEADELAATIAANWAKETDPSAGAQVRFLRLSSGTDFLVYSTLAAQDVVLSMAFQAETPLGQIRKQAKRATEALVSPADSSPTPQVKPSAPAVAETPAVVTPPVADFLPQPASLKGEPALPNPVLASKVKTKPLPPLPDFMPDPNRAPTPAPVATIDDVEVGLDWASALRTPPEGFQPDWAPATNPLAQPVEPEAMPQPDEDLEPIPDEDALNALSTQLLQLERQSLIEQPSLLDLAPTPLPNIRRTPHGLYDLSYTFLFLPRLPHITLTGDLKARLEQWLIALADTHDWDASQIQIEEDHVEVSLQCAPADSPERIIKTILAETSDKVLSEYPRLAAAHAKRPGAFWASGYYVVTPGRRLSPDEVNAFVQYQRHEQNGGKM